MKRVLVVALAVALLAAAMGPAAADAKGRRVQSSIAADVFGITGRHGGVAYAFGGEVGAQGLTFACMGGRQVTLFRAESNGTGTPVGSTQTDFLGSFGATIER